MIELYSTNLFQPFFCVFKKELPKEHPPEVVVSAPTESTCKITSTR